MTVYVSNEEIDKLLRVNGIKESSIMLSFVSYKPSFEIFR